MEKLDMKSKDKVQENIEKIRELFPNCVTEISRGGVVSSAVDFDKLKQEMSDMLIDDGEERYQMTWPNKRNAVLLANTPISATLRPCKEESVDFDNTKNLYIEGDNLDVLKLLQETYLGKIKMIYIDPPYNTGKDSFVYNDCYSMNEEEFLNAGGYYDSEGNRVVDIKDNNESNGRFHTEWLNMLYPRLRLARDLLTDDGVIFISIDDNELNNLIGMINEIFSEKNLINIITIKTNETKGLKNAYVNKCFPKNKEYLLVVAKNANMVNFNSEKVKKSEEELKKYMRYYNKYIPNIEEDCSKWEIKDFAEFTKGKTDTEIFYLKENTKNRLIYLVTPDNLDENKIPCEREKFYKVINSKGTTVYYYRDKNGDIYTALFLENNYYKNLGDLWVDISTININKETCGMPTYANGQKPIKLVERIIKYMLDSSQDGIVMDFFSGSSTVAHAVLELNSKDGGNRSFIMVQIQEDLDKNLRKQSPDQRKDTQKIIDFLDSIGKMHLITEYGKERIRRAGKKIKEESPLTTTNLDTGFRVLKLDSSNMKDVYYKPEETTRTLLDMLEDNIKEDRTPLDLLFQVMLDLGHELSAKIEEKTVEGKQIFSFFYNDIIACFDDDITEKVVTKIAKLKPLYAVFRDSGMASDSAHTNFEQIFAAYSPNTIRKVI